MSRSSFVLATTVLVLTPAIVLAGAPTRIALVIGSNEAPREYDLSPLQFADDDAFRNSEVLRELGAEVTTLATFDPQIQAQFPKAAATAIPPKIKNLRDAVERLRGQIADIRRANPSAVVEFYFWFSGHGGLRATDQSLYLQDGEFTKTDLRSMLSRSEANYNHVILDACHAGAVVAPKGSTDATEARMNQVLDAQLAHEYASWDNAEATGFVFASPAHGRTYESSRLRAGVVSHEVRSALSGGADVNLDGDVSYPELDAFLVTTNSGIAEPLLKLDVKVVAPRQDVQHPIASWTGRPVRVLWMKSPIGMRFSVVDNQDTRLVEVNVNGSYPLALILPPRKSYRIVRHDNHSWSFKVDAGAVVLLDEVLSKSEDAQWLVERGDESLEEALRAGLFANSFGKDKYGTICDARREFYGVCALAAGMTFPDRASVNHQAKPASKVRGTIVPWALAASALTSAAIGVAFYAASGNAYDRYQMASTNDELSHWKTQTQKYDLAATISFGVAGAAALGAAGAFVWNWKANRHTSSLQLGPCYLGYAGSY